DAPPDRGPGVEQGDPELVDPPGVGDGTEATGAVEAWAMRSVTCRSELRTTPVPACRMAFSAFSLTALNSASVNWMARWFRSARFSRSAGSGMISATTLRWSWVSLTGMCCGSAGMVSPLVLDLFLVDGEARLQVVRQGSGVVLGVGVQPEAPGAV